MQIVQHAQVTRLGNRTRGVRLGWLEQRALDSLKNKNSPLFSSSSFKAQKAEKGVIGPFVTFLKHPTSARLCTYEGLL